MSTVPALDFALPSVDTLLLGFCLSPFLPIKEK